MCDKEAFFVKDESFGAAVVDDVARVAGVADVEEHVAVELLVELEAVSLALFSSEILARVADPANEVTIYTPDNPEQKFNLPREADLAEFGTFCGNGGFRRSSDSRP